MKTQTGQHWWDQFIRWGGQSYLVEIDGWGRHDWFHKKISAEEFFERYMASLHCSKCSKCDESISDVEEFFLLVCHEEET